MVLISILVMACVLGAEALARARDARKPDNGRNRCAQKRASAASPRRKTPLPQLGIAATQLRPRKMARSMPPMLRLALLCHLSVAVEGADRAATNLACLVKYPEEVFLDLTGAITTALPKGIPQADALGVCGAGSSLLHNNLGGMGNIAGPQSADSQLPDACVGKKQDDACSTAMGALAPSTQSPRGRPASPCTSPRVRSHRKRHRP